MGNYTHSCHFQLCFQQQVLRNMLNNLAAIYKKRERNYNGFQVPTTNRHLPDGGFIQPEGFSSFVSILPHISSMHIGNRSSIWIGSPSCPYTSMFSFHIVSPTKHPSTRPLVYLSHPRWHPNGKNGGDQEASSRPPPPTLTRPPGQPGETGKSGRFSPMFSDSSSSRPVVQRHSPAEGRGGHSRKNDRGQTKPCENHLCTPWSMTCLLEGHSSIES